MAAKLIKKAAFLDRDGTINADTGYTYKVEDLRFLPGAIEALRVLKKAGFLLIVISNQSGIGRGYFSETDLIVFHKAMNDLLKIEGAEIDAFYYCPHSPEETCTCRKPSPYLLNLAAEEFSIDMSSSFMFGDKTSDTQAGQAAGVKSFLVEGEKDLFYWVNYLGSSGFDR